MAHSDGEYGIVSCWIGSNALPNCCSLLPLNDRSFCGLCCSLHAQEKSPLDWNLEAPHRLHRQPAHVKIPLSVDLFNRAWSWLIFCYLLIGTVWSCSLASMLQLQKVSWRQFTVNSQVQIVGLWHFFLQQIKRPLTKNFIWRGLSSCCRVCPMMWWIGIFSLSCLEKWRIMFRWLS